MKQKIKLGIILGVEFVAIAAILILVFLAGKKTYTVTFDLNGGTLISGELVQTVPQGKNATPPNVAKDGCYLRSWSASYKQVTHDTVIEAVWEWEIITTVGFVYSSTDNSDYCIIEDSFDNLYDDVYVPTHHDNKKILGIADGVFRDRDGITNIHMLDGIISIGEGVFADCDNLVSVELPGTLKNLGVGAFENCASLEKVVFSDELTAIPQRAFAGCTSLKEIVIPPSVKTVGKDAFIGCTSLEKITFETEEIIENDENGVPTGIVRTVGLENIKSGAFSGCEALVEIVLPVTVANIETGAFNNPLLTVYTPVPEENIPEGWADGWNGEALVEWSFTAPDTAEEEENSKKRSWL